MRKTVAALQNKGGGNLPEFRTVARMCPKCETEGLGCGRRGGDKGERRKGKHSKEAEARSEVTPPRHP